MAAAASVDDFIECYSFPLNFAIESIASFGDIVFAGTQDGHLLTYSVKRSNAAIEFDLLKRDHHFSSKSIRQIEIAPVADEICLFSLSDATINVHKIDHNNLHSRYAMLHAGSETKGASSFVLNIKKTAGNSWVQICVAMSSNNLHFYNWKQNNFQTFGNPVEIGQIPEQMKWYKGTIFIRLRHALAIYDLASKTIRTFEWNIKSITFVNGFCSIIKDNCLVAFDKITGELRDETPFKPVERLGISDLVWDRPFMYGVKENNGVVVLQLRNGEFSIVRTFPTLDHVKQIIHLSKGLILAACDANIYCILKKRDPFYCYNCGEQNTHFSKNCTRIIQQFTRCPQCNCVAKSPAGHKIACTNSTFISRQIGSYELPLMDSLVLRFIFTNVNRIYCTDGNADYLITKFFTADANVKFRRIFDGSKNIIIDVKLKPAVNFGIYRRGTNRLLASMLFCSNQIRINHFYHVDAEGNVSYNITSGLRKDGKHDIQLKLDTNAPLVNFRLIWNKRWTADIFMSENDVWIRPYDEKTKEKFEQ